VDIIESNAKLIENLNNPDRFLCSRLGVVESQIVDRFIEPSGQVPLKLRKLAWINAGIFPPSKSTFKIFTSLYIEALVASDLIAAWPSGLQPSHDRVLNSICTATPRIGMDVLDIFNCAETIAIESIWISHLEGKKVLVIHPFAQSFRNQFDQLKKLHRLPILPEFNAVFSAPPMTQGFSVKKSTYAEQLSNYLSQLEQITHEESFDIALIAAGAYGLPIANHLKGLGLSSIYVGGTLQLYFGVEGARWANRENLQKFRTQNWLQHPMETPPRGSQFIEGKTYW
jgi:hypothetical protein